jgi:hypothetical protein
VIEPDWLVGEGKLTGQFAQHEAFHQRPDRRCGSGGSADTVMVILPSDPWLFCRMSRGHFAEE